MSAIEWTQDLGDGRRIVMERVFAGYRAAFAGLRGVGSTQNAALDDLLARMRDYGMPSDDLARSLAPGGHLYQLLQTVGGLASK